MKRLGVTGHQMRDGIDWAWVRREVRRVLDVSDVGAAIWTCLATGADTIAAQEALACGRDVKVVVPHAGYENVFADDDRQTFLALLRRSSEVVQMSHAASDEDAYLAAGLRVADESELLIVVWDGKPAAGKGGTGDIARYARDRGTSVIWLDTRGSKTRSLAEAFT